jgi:hypothetical protein
VIKIDKGDKIVKDLNTYGKGEYNAGRVKV